ncbi:MULTISPECIES: DUF3283 family protein [Aeromonas]|uniref:DUF3283 family protein n=1 Tax=Aeromonas TaxID=642 RepID=UPI0012FDFDA5|nr:MULTISPECIES: DUF3283 family protein [Aeromonas]MBM0439308.1 DUF3283 family protein [Aeromonas hydrophila subsp. ranae]MBW3826944.1 DUF3283 family protein [Aeromonas hydrophila]MDD9230233.1 DUF3283 family protein [Aeromonas hydrophila]QJT13602.1 DUF3283 family protein [Aeromonas sp. 2692-1]
MSHNLCALPKEQQERVEVEKAAAYAVWKERNGQLAVVVSEPKPRQERVRERVVW